MLGPLHGFGRDVIVQNIAMSLVETQKDTSTRVADRLVRVSLGPSRDSINATAKSAEVGKVGTLARTQLIRGLGVPLMNRKVVQAKDVGKTVGPKLGRELSVFQLLYLILI